MKAEKYRHRFNLQTKSATRDSYGAETVSWTTKATVWGKITPLSGREYFQAQQVQSQVTHKISMRYYPGVRPDWRILWGTRVFNIVSAINVEERNIEWEIMATEFVT